MDLQTVEYSEHTTGFLNSHCHVFVCTSFVLTDYTVQIGKLCYLHNLLVIQKEWLVIGGMDAKKSVVSPGLFSEERR